MPLQTVLSVVHAFCDTSSHVYTASNLLYLFSWEPFCASLSSWEASRLIQDLSSQETNADKRTTDLLD